MKKAFILILFFCFTKFAHAGSKIDSVYYLINIQTPVNDQMWDVHEENPSLKFYVIKCACLPHDNEPAFVYDILTAKADTIDKRKLEAIKLTSLTALLKDTREIYKYQHHEDYCFFIIEPVDEKYVMHKVRLVPYYVGASDRPEIKYRVDSIQSKKG